MTAFSVARRRIDGRPVTDVTLTPSYLHMNTGSMAIFAAIRRLVALSLFDGFQFAPAHPQPNCQADIDNCYNWDLRRDPKRQLRRPTGSCRYRIVDYGV